MAKTDLKKNKMVAAIILGSSKSFSPEQVVVTTEEWAPVDTNPDIPLATYEIDGQSISVVAADQPLETDALNKAIAAARTWPEAKQVAGATDNHIVVGTNESPTGHKETEAASLAVAKLAAEFARRPDAAAVYWPESGALIPAEGFVDAVSQPDVSIGLVNAWVHLTWYKADPKPGEEKPQLAVATTGLARFIGREIDFLPSSLSPTEIAKNILHIAKYLIDKGPVIGDGDTLGFDEVRAIRSRIVEQGYRPGIPVYALQVIDAGTSA